MLYYLSLMAAGLASLMGGGNALVKGASALALRLGVSPVIVGLTVVAFGTSTPELVVNLAAAFRGTPEIGFGNVVGSNIANLGLLLASAAVVAPLVIHRTLVTREIPMMILAAVAALVLGAGGIPGETASGSEGGAYPSSEMPPTVNNVCFRFRPPAAASIPTGPDHQEPGNSGSVGSGEAPGDGRVEGRFGNSLGVD